MSEIKVTEMTEATQINDNDLLMIVQNEKSKKAKVSTIKKQEYSIEETKVGTWNGKPIYRKTIVMSNVTETTKTYDWLTTRKEMSNALKQNSTCLEEIKNTNKNNAETNRNTAKSLELLQSSMDTQKEFLFQHDKRCEDIEKNIEKIEIRLEERV